MKTVLITGCSDGGIGSALAKAFQSHNLHVFATTRDVSKMKELAELPNITMFSLDVTDSSSISAAVNRVKNQTGGTLDFLVNNCARNYFMPTLDIDIEVGKKMYDINLWGALAMMQAFSPLIVAGKGTFVNITSIGGHLNVPFMGLYSGSKRALEILSETLRLEMEPFGVKVVEVVTGAVVSKGQTYFQDMKLPANSIFLPIEDTIVNRAQGGDGHPRMATNEYAASTVDDILAGATGRIWKGNNAEGTLKSSGIGIVPQSKIDQGVLWGTDLEKLRSDK